MEKIADRQAQKAGIAFGESWSDPDLAAALPAVRAGDIDKGLELLRTAPTPDLRSLRLDTFAGECTHLLEALELRKGDDDPALLLWAGAARVQAAWKIRTAARARDVGAERFRRFHAFLEPAAEPLLRAAGLDDEDPDPWNILQWYCMGMGIRREDSDKMWLQLCARDSWHWAGRVTRLQVLCEKWYGSHEEMFAFARETAALASPGDPCLTLLPQAHREYVVVLLDGAETVGDIGRRVRAHFSAPGVAAELAEAADRWEKGDGGHPEHRAQAHEFGAALYYAGERERAARVLAPAGRLVSRVSLWSYAENWPLEGLRRALRDLGLL